MSARRIARELAIIVMPQLPKNTEKLNEVEIMQLSDKAIHMLVDYARQNLMDAQALVVTASNELTEIEVEHESNKNLVEDLKAVPLNSGQIKEKLRTLETAISLVSEALDIPDMAMASGSVNLHANCKKCGTGINISVEKPHKEEVRNFVVRLVTNYLDNKDLIDEFIKRARTKWRVERMVSVDRDILRLACAEAFYARHPGQSSSLRSSGIIPPLCRRQSRQVYQRYPRRSCRRSRSGKKSLCQETV